MQIYNIRAEFIPVNFDNPAKLVEKTIQANGVYNASDDNADGYSSVTVVVPATPIHIQELNVTPSTQAQTITAPAGLDGYAPINVSAVENVLPQNIKQGETILGVQGSVVELNGETVNVSPSTSQQVIEPTAPKNAITRATVAPVTSAIDSNIQPGNIKEGVTILETTGTLYVPETYRSFTKEELGPNQGYILKTNIQANRTIDFTGIVEISSYLLAYAYGSGFSIDSNTALTGPIDMSDVKYIRNYGCFHTFDTCTKITSLDLSSLGGLSQYCCSGICNRCTGLLSVDLSALDLISSGYAFELAFWACTSLKTVNMSNMYKITGANYAFNRAFEGCSSIETMDLGKLNEVNSTYACSRMFDGCSSLREVDLSCLTIIGTNGTYSFSSAFNACTSLTNMSLSSLTTITAAYVLQSMFKDCTGLTTLSFPSLTPNSFGTRNTQFNTMLQGVTGCTVHFPSNIQTKIGSWTDVTNGFGGTNTTVLFDLPATVTLTGADAVTYTRNPKYDTGTALAWKVGAYGTTDFTPAYYTSGTTDPQAGATIYSDSACTTSVTTISSIA